VVISLFVAFSKLFVRPGADYLGDESAARLICKAQVLRMGTLALRCLLFWFFGLPRHSSDWLRFCFGSSACRTAGDGRSDGVETYWSWLGLSTDYVSRCPTITLSSGFARPSPVISQVSLYYYDGFSH
jgi:hypothetical protein